MIKAALRRILGRKRSYHRVFLDGNGNIGPDAEVVLADLKRFCRASASTVVVSPVSKAIDPLAMAMAEGRREVWNRIMAHLHIDDKLVAQLKEPDYGEE